MDAVHRRSCQTPVTEAIGRSIVAPGEVWTHAAPYPAQRACFSDGRTRLELLWSRAPSRRLLVVEPTWRRKAAPTPLAADGRVARQGGAADGHTTGASTVRIARGELTRVLRTHVPAIFEELSEESIWDVHCGVSGLGRTRMLLFDAELLETLCFEDVAFASPPTPQSVATTCIHGRGRSAPAQMPRRSCFIRLEPARWAIPRPSLRQEKCCTRLDWCVAGYWELGSTGSGTWPTGRFFGTSSVVSS